MNRQKTASNYQNSEIRNPIKMMFSDIKKSIQASGKNILVLLITFLVVTSISFFDAASKETVASFALSEYEIGQIAEKTIIADKTLLPTPENQIAITKGDKIIKKGFPITEESYNKLKKMAETPSYVDFREFANSILYFFVILFFTCFLYGKKMLGRILSVRESIFIASLYLLVYALCVFASKTVTFSSPFLLPIFIPASFCVALITIIYGQVVAVYFGFLITFSVLQVASFNPIPALFILCTSIATARIVRKTEKRIDLVFSSLVVGLLNGVFLFMLYVIFNEESNCSPLPVLGVIFNGFISGILALGFLTPLESILNTASVFRLMDLSDLNTPIMKKLLLTASGTYNHSMMVATLAESACLEIGAKALLARVGGYYHDIGKIDQPEYFVENLAGEKNKHQALNPSLSVSIIRSHVKKGIEKARQLHLPKEVIDIITEHHGNSVVVYFFNEAKKLDNSVSQEEFSYPGPTPSTRESAVVMLADTVEAACHTLERPSVPRLEKFVRQLIMDKYEANQLDTSGLTFSDLDLIQASFVKILAGYYHSRIEYPNQKSPDEIDEIKIVAKKTEVPVKEKTSRKTKNEQSVN